MVTVFLKTITHANYTIFFFSKSASCTELIYALASLKFAHQQGIDLPLPLDDEEALPVTLYLCQWNMPCKRKESNMPISKAVFQKHVYGRQRKHELKPIRL